MTWVFMVLFITVGGIQVETSRPFRDYVSCEHARAQVIMAYQKGDRMVLAGVRLVTKECVAVP